MLNVNRIGQQVSFRALSSADLNQKYQASPAAASTETATPEKSSNRAKLTMKAIVLVTGVAILAKLAKTGKLGETAKNYVAKAAERISPYLESAKASVTGAYESVKTKVLELKDKAVGVFNKAEKTAE